ncbi:hypothetical protein [Thiocystis violacea]|uniref:hypothetical protein n=1 Tax=Thiocystis violacea TaxID=13725 RepID=UPI0019035228|nr:hypothetical protein [Thiocystis violacea]MBK1723443.1 hypothetical protein [Thiocystis violacea]
MHPLHLHAITPPESHPPIRVLWHLPLILAGLVAAYELGAGHLVLAALVAGLLLAFQTRMDRADGGRASGNVSSRGAKGDGGTRCASATQPPLGNRPMVLDGGSLEHRQQCARGR